jgi:hypothetical protein
MENDSHNTLDIERELEIRRAQVRERRIGRKFWIIIIFFQGIVK